MAMPSWERIFIPQAPLLEILIRGTLTYLCLFALLRVLIKRRVGTLSISDLLLIVLIADAAQNAMAADFTSVPDGVLLCATIVAWSYLLDWLSFRFPRLRHWIEPSPLPLVRNGRLQRRNMRQELISDEELISQLRRQGSKIRRASRQRLSSPTDTSA